jgi:hypothetical protein
MSTNITSATSNKKLKTINPATEEVLDEYELISKDHNILLSLHGVKKEHIQGFKHCNEIY